MPKSTSEKTLSPSQLITDRIAELSDWRGQLFAQSRKIILASAPGITEEWKWGTAVWSQNGNVVSVAAMKDHLKINFFKGASLDDPKKLFNAGLDAKATRAIDLFKGDRINESALGDLMRRAVSFNASGGRKK